jgi:hypothetical protein
MKIEIQTPWENSDPLGAIVIIEKDVRGGSQGKLIKIVTM